MAAARRTVCQVSDLAVNYGAGPVVEAVSFTLRAGEVTALLGSNGAGKSTVLNCIAGVLTATAGRITVDGITQTPGHDQPDYRRRLAVVADEPALFDDLTPRQHARFYAGAWGVADAQERLAELAEAFRLSDRLDDMTGHFSRGMRQKTGLLLAFLHPASVYLLDEPYAGLDAAARDHLTELLRAACAGGAAALVATHALGRVAPLADRVFRLADGHLTVEAASAQDPSSDV